jgi:hypothetical protein
VRSRAKDGRKRSFKKKALEFQTQESSFESQYDSDDARDAIVPSPISRTPSYSTLTSQSSSKPPRLPEIEPIAEDELPGEDGSQRYVDLGALLKRQSKWISLDDSRYTGYGPKKTKSLSSLAVNDFPSESDNTYVPPSIQRKIFRGSGLPNPKMHFDQRQVKMHLALRTAEIVACAEAMWEWVADYQAKLKEQEAQKAQQTERVALVDSYGYPPRKSISSNTATHSTTGQSPRDKLRESLSMISREEFDRLVVFFQL